MLRKAMPMPMAAMAKRRVPPTKMANPAAVVDAGDGVAVAVVRVALRAIAPRHQAMQRQLMRLRAMMRRTP